MNLFLSAGYFTDFYQPTGGPTLLHDARPDEPKTLVEEKLKKVTTERAPVAPAGGSSGRAGRSGLGGGSTLLDALNRQAAGNDLTLSDLNNIFRPSRTSSEGATGTPAREGGSGAAAAAGVLTAVDEDEEEDEEAEVPKEFDYFTDEEEDDE